MKRFSLRYNLLTSKLDQLWFPFAFFGVFVIIGILRGENYIVDTTRAYLGAVIPLLGGIMASYSVLEDPSLELRFATPVSTLQTMLERLLPSFLIEAFFALAYQLFAAAFGADLASMYGLWGNLQIAWMVPTISLMALGFFTAIVAAKSTIGALFAGMVWLVELVAREWFLASDIGKYFLVYMSIFYPDNPALRNNQFALVWLGLILFMAAWVLLKKQERYI